ncbi:MAG TPA: sensor histidine kinase [Devosia sp.]|nr:sensor histidine kinase [Devosia sp.]
MPTSTSAAEVAKPPGAQNRSRSIAVYLFVLALVALVPAFAFSAILLQRNNEAQERVVEALITGSARSIMQAVDREVNANVSTLKVLGTTPTLQAGDLRGFYDQVRTALLGSGTWVYVLDRNFYSILSTRGDFGAPPVLSADIATAKAALDSKDVAVSGLVIGTVSGQKVFNVLYPVFTGALAPVVLAISRNAGSLETALLSDKLPDGWNVAMVDKSGTIIAASHHAGETGEPFTVADVNQLDTTLGLITLHSDKGNYRAAVRKSLLTGWTLIAWAPASVISQPLMDAVWSLAVGGLLLAAIVVLVVYWVTLQIGRSVRGLESDAKRLGTGAPVTARDYPISEIATVSAALEEASKRRQQAEIEVRFLMRELAHRSKNQMTVIAAMAKQTARGAESVPEFVQSFERRIFGLARSTDLLLANGVVGVDLRELLLGQLDPFRPEDEGRMTVEGPATRLNVQAAQILGMAAHELATNAVKYGAFQKDGGSLSVTWARGPENLDFDWRETARSFVPPTGRKGFGTTVLENMVGRSLGAQVERIVHPDGLEWRFSIPLGAIDPARGPEEAEKPAN